MGIYYYHSKGGVDPDDKQVIAWFTKAAEQGHTDALNHLGRCYYYGLCVDLDVKQALMLFTKSVEQDPSSAKKILDKYYSGSRSDKYSNYTGMIPGIAKTALNNPVVNAVSSAIYWTTKIPMMVMATMLGIIELEHRMHKKNRKQPEPEQQDAVQEIG